MDLGHEGRRLGHTREHGITTRRARSGESRESAGTRSLAESIVTHDDIIERRIAIVDESGSRANYDTRLASDRMDEARSVEGAADN